MRFNENSGSLHLFIILYLYNTASYRYIILETLQIDCLEQKMFKLLFDENACLHSLAVDDIEFAVPDKFRLFTVHLRDFVGNPLRFTRKDFSSSRVEKHDSEWELHFSKAPFLPEMEVVIRVSVDDEKSVWTLEVIQSRKEISVEWVSFPELPLRQQPGMKYLLPYAEGTLLDDLDQRQHNSTFPCREAAYPLTGVSNFYPGPAAMQFEACYTSSGKGLYFCTEDRFCSPKSVDFMPDGDAEFYPFIQHFTGGKNQLHYQTVIRGFSGEWQDAAEIYREYLGRSGILPEKLEKRAPEWLMDHPVLLIYPVKGRGIDHGDMSFNEFYPYDRALPLIRKFHDSWQNPVMPLLMHWEGTAPWAPPYVWPPAGGVEALENFGAALHRENDRLGLYCSGIGWTQQSMIDRNYDCRQKFEDKNLKDEICLGPQGEAYANVCNGPSSQRIGYELCPSRRFTIDTVCSQIAPAAAVKVDYMQYFDQNQGCTSPLCYNDAHDHGRFPDHRQTQAMVDLLACADESAGEMVLGCENAAAEPYMNVCMLNDLRSHLAWGAAGHPVPLYPYLFHEYVAGFTGNGVCLNAWVDFSRTPFFMQWILGWNFVNGNLLAVVLKDGGDIHWSWCSRWDAPAPEQLPLKTLIGNLCRWQRGAAKDALTRGKMVKTPKVHCSKQQIFTTDGRITEIPSVECAAYQIDGREEVLLVNYNCTAMDVEVCWDNECRGTIYYPDDEENFSAEKVTVKVFALNSILIKLN